MCAFASGGLFFEARLKVFESKSPRPVRRDRDRVFDQELYILT